MNRIMNGKLVIKLGEGGHFWGMFTETGEMVCSKSLVALSSSGLVNLEPLPKNWTVTTTK